jgi:hypothetical protein
MIPASNGPPAYRRTSALIACALGLTVASGAGAQSMDACGDWKQITEHLEKEYGEVIVGLGLDNSGRMILEVYASPSGTWTVLVTVAGGPSCIRATGQGWQSAAPQKPGRPS